MIISMQNFKQHEAFSLELPKNGLVLLKGDSGAGKTTILKGFAFALFDAVKKPYTYGTKSCSVELQDFGGLSIKRQKGPNRLIVDEKEDQEAQLYLEKVLGMNETEFMASSYIQQKMQSSLLSLSAPNQLAFIEKLAFGDEQPETYKKIIVAKISYIEKQIESLKSQIDQNKKAQESLLKQIDILVRSCPTQQEPPSIFQEALERELQSLSVDLIEAKAQEQLLTQELLSPDHELNAKIEIFESRLEQKKKDVELQKANFFNGVWEGYLGDLENAQRIKSIAEGKEKNKLLKIELEKEESAAKIVKDDLHSSSSKKRDLADLGSKKAEASKVISEKINKCKEQIGALKSIIELQKEKLICPNCGSASKLQNSKLVPFENKSFKTDDLEKLEKELQKYEFEERELDQEISKIRKEYRDVVAKIACAETVLHAKEMNINTLRLQILDNLSEISCEYSLSDIEKYISDNKEMEKENAIVKRVVSNISLEIKNIEEIIKEMKERAIHVRSKEDISKELEAVKGTRVAAETAISNAKRHIEQWKLYREKEKAIAEITKNVQKTQDLLRETAVTELDLQNKLNDLQEDLSALHDIKERSDKAQMEAISSKVESINLAAKEFLDILFPNDPCVVELRTFKENLNKTVKPKLSLLIQYKGKEYTDLDEVSGGEDDRITLAYQLALNSIYNSPIFMLDECFTGVQADLRDLALSAIKNSISKDKLVLVISHGANEGLFDEVIEI